MSNEKVIELLEKAILMLREQATKSEPSMTDAEYLELAKRIEINAENPKSRTFVRNVLNFHAANSYLTDEQRKAILRTASMQKITHEIRPE